LPPRPCANSRASCCDDEQAADQTKLGSPSRVNTLRPLLARVLQPNRARHTAILDPEAAIRQPPAGFTVLGPALNSPCMDGYVCPPIVGDEQLTHRECME
jgi:hypothetical protein